MKQVISVLIITLIIASIFILPAFAEAGRTKINQQDFYGDITFFDNRYCYIAQTPAYRRFSSYPKDGGIIRTTRLENYQSADRTDYIYMERTKAENDCYFEVNVQKIPDIANTPSINSSNPFGYKYLKVEGDFKSTTLQNIQFLVRGSETATSGNLDSSIVIASDGKVWAGSASSITDIAAKKEFHLLWFINLADGTSDIYINNAKVLENIPLGKNIKWFRMVRVSLPSSSILGNLYVDNFNVSGLINPIVDGVENKTAVIPTDENIIDFMSDKVGMHTYGNTLYKDGTKSLLENEGIYDEDTEQYYVTVDVLNKAFDINLQDSGGTITGEISIDREGNVVGQSRFKLQYLPKTENGIMYVPIREFAEKAIGKYVWWFKTGILLFTDYPLNIDTSSWEWQSARSETGKCTIWNDIDYLNGFLQYIRPNENILSLDLKTLSSHPRLYFTADEFDQMKKKYTSREDTIFSDGIDKFIKDADNYILEGAVTYDSWSDSMRHSAGMLMSDRFKAFGLAYYMTGKQKYVDAAYAQFEEASNFPDFNTAHIIDTGDAAIGLAIGYDWFYNAFTTQQREVALQVLRRDCLDVLASGLYGRLTSSSSGAVEWRAFKLKSNYNTIVNTGVVLASIASIEYDSKQAFTYIKDSLRSVEYSLQMFPPDGAWTEGPAYLEYTLRYLISLSHNLEKNFGSSYNLMDGQGMAGIMDFMIAINGVDGSNNMGDADLRSTPSYESYFYFAERFQKPYASYMRWNDLKRGISSTFYDLVFYDFDATNIDISTLKNVPTMHQVDGIEVFSVHDTYDKDNSGFYFSTHFGTTSGNHQHWDCATFVLDLFGKRWAYDLGKDDYNLQNELGYEGYQIFRKRAEAHNMLVINPDSYTTSVEINSNRFAPIISAEANNSGGYVIADMSDVYNESTDMTLGYYIDDNMNSVTMRNEFTLSRALPCTWGMITKGIISIDGNTAYITQGNDSIKLQVISDGNNVKWMDCGTPKPSSDSFAQVFAAQNQNTGYKQLKLFFTANEGDNKLIIKISPKYGSSTSISDVPFNTWQLPDEDELVINEGLNMLTAYANLQKDTIVLAGYLEDGTLSNVVSKTGTGHTTVSLNGDFYMGKVFRFKDFLSLNPIVKAKDYTMYQNER